MTGKRFAAVLTIVVLFAVWVAFRLPTVTQTTTTPKVGASRAATVTEQTRTLDDFVGLTPAATVLGESVRDVCFRSGGNLLGTGAVACERQVVRYVGIDRDWAELKQTWIDQVQAAGWFCIPPPLMRASGRTGCRAPATTGSVTVAWTDKASHPYTTPGLTTPPPAEPKLVTDQAVDETKLYQDAFGKHKHRFVVEMSVKTQYYGPAPDDD